MESTNETEDTQAATVVAALVSAAASLELLAQCALTQLQLDAERVLRKVNPDGTLVHRNN